MRFGVAICFWILIRLPCFGQIDFTVDYFPYIHQADLEIVNGDYTEALRLYDQAFEHVHDGFRKYHS
jgi:hypothetical protein